MFMLTKVRALLVPVCLLLAAVPAATQVASPSKESVLPNGITRAAPTLALPETETIRTRVDEVNVVFTVTDGSGRFVSKLSLDDVDVLDNQRLPERISYFQQQTDLPLRVGLLVDLSDSITDRFNYEKKAAITFLQKVLRPQLDEAFLVGFNSEVTLLQDFTGDVNALSKAVNTMRPGGDTKLYDAVRFAAGKLRNGSGMTLSRRAIILISDGVDTRSSTVMYDAIQTALHAEAVIFALSSNEMNERDEFPAGEAALHLITRPTGGGVLPAHTKSEIAHAFDKVKDALHSQYAVGYKPAAFKPDGTFRTIKIVPRKGKLRVQCRRGYFAPREDRDRTSHALSP